MAPRTSSPQGQLPRCDLTLLATTDLHLHLCPWDYYTDRPTPGRGLAAAAPQINALRAGFANSLLLDNGDFLQGTALGDALAEARPPAPGHPHPMVAAFNLMRYDAVALGNHDFNYGLGFLAAALAGAQFPVVCANLRRIDGGVPLFTGWTLLERQVLCHDGRRRKLKIGVAGFLPPQVMVWDAAHLEGRIEAGGIVATAARVVPQMIAAGAEVVVALCHSGIGTLQGGLAPDAEHAALALATVPGIDAVVAGHTHQVFPGPDFPASPGIDRDKGLLAGKPACMAGFAASHLGLVHLTLEQGPDRRWRCTGGKGDAVSLAAVAGTGPPQPQPQIAAPFLTLCDTVHAATRRHLDRPAGRSEIPLTSLFAMAGDCIATRLTAQALRWHVGEMLRGTAFAHLPVLAAAAPTRVGGRGGPSNFIDLPAGDLRERDLTALCPFPNAVRALHMTGAALADWLEHSAGAFHQIAPGAQDATLLNPDWPAYNFDQIEGLTYRIDLSQPARFTPDGRAANPGDSRIRDLCHNGKPVAATDEFVLATTSYRAAGGGAYPGTGQAARQVLAAPTPVRGIIGAWLALQGPFRAPQSPVWTFAAHPGTTAVLHTGPAALAHLPRAGLEPLGLCPDGFLRLRLAL